MRPTATWLGLVPMLALTLAGCVSSSIPLQPAGIGSIAAGPLHFLDAKAMDQPTGGGEPNIAVLPDGTMFITAVAGSQERPNALQGAAWLWRSRDHGATWETVRSPTRDTPLGTDPLGVTRRPFGSSDADVAASADGWVYSTDWWNWGIPVGGTPIGRYGSYLVERSSDSGQTWDSAPVTTLDSVGGVDRQWLLAGNDGFVGLFYAYFHSQQNLQRGLLDPSGRADGIMSIQAVFSHDHGQTWGDPVTVVEPIPGHGYEIAHPRILPEGTLWMPYGDFQQGSDGWHNPSKVIVMLSNNNGTSWYPREVANVPEGFDNLWAVQGASDDAGRMYVAWASRTGENMTLWVSQSEDQARSWTAPRGLREEGLNFLPWVAARSDGQAAVGWYGGDAVGTPERAPNETAWFAYAAETTDAGRSWRVDRVSPEPVKTGPMCPKGASCSGNRELLDYVSLAYGPDGALHYSFARSREVAGLKAGLVHYAGTALAAPSP